MPQTRGGPHNSCSTNTFNFNSLCHLFFVHGDYHHHHHLAVILQRYLIQICYSSIILPFCVFSCHKPCRFPSDHFSFIHAIIYLVINLFLEPSRSYTHFYGAPYMGAPVFLFLRYSLTITIPNYKFNNAN